MLELAILGLLTDEPRHGYELKRRLGDTLGFASGVSFGSLYPALGRLEAAGAVAAVDPDGSSPTVPLTGSLGGELAAIRARTPAPRGRRGKKVYRITPAGRALFAELLTAESSANDDDRVFALRLAFARHLPPDARLGMLERRRARLVERLTQLRARVRAGVDRLDSYARTLAEHDRDIAEQDLSWIERLIATERAAAAAARTDLTGDGRVPSPPSEPPAGPATGWAPSISALLRPQTDRTEGLRPSPTQEDIRP